MREHLWTLRRGTAQAVAELRDLGVNGTEIELRIGSGKPQVDRFADRPLAVAHATAERRRLERSGWRRIASEREGGPGSTER